MSDYYDDLYFGKGTSDSDEVGCDGCGMTCCVGEDEHGRSILLDPGTREKHICNGTVHRPPAVEGESTDETFNQVGEVDYIDYD